MPCNQEQLLLSATKENLGAASKTAQPETTSLKNGYFTTMKKWISLKQTPVPHPENFMPMTNTKPFIRRVVLSLTLLPPETAHTATQPHKMALISIPYKSSENHGFIQSDFLEGRVTYFLVKRHRLSKTQIKHTQRGRKS